MKEVLAFRIVQICNSFQPNCSHIDPSMYTAEIYGMRMRFLLAILDVYKDMMLSIIMVQNLRYYLNGPSISLLPSVHYTGKILTDRSNKIHKRCLQQIECNICCEFGIAFMENHFTDWLLWKSCHLSNTLGRPSKMASLQDRRPRHVHVQYACVEINENDGINGQSLYWTAEYTVWCEPIYLSAVGILGTCSRYDFEAPFLIQHGSNNRYSHCLLLGPFY